MASDRLNDRHRDNEELRLWIEDNWSDFMIKLKISKKELFRIAWDKSMPAVIRRLAGFGYLRPKTNAEKQRENEELRSWLIKVCQRLVLEYTEDYIICLADDTSYPIIIRNLARRAFGLFDIGKGYWTKLD